MSQDVGAIMLPGTPIAPNSIDEIKSAFDINIEVHCRRCASHMGHVLLVENHVLHCINGTSHDFVPTQA